MTNNEILRSLRYTFRQNEESIKNIFAHVEQNITKDVVTSWLKKDEDDGFNEISNENLSHYLNGLIIEKRGKKSPEDPTPLPDADLNNNKVFKKLKIALNLQSQDIIDVLQSADFNMSLHELTAFFRKEGHKNYRHCKNQILRNFLLGLNS